MLHEANTFLLDLVKTKKKKTGKKDFSFNRRQIDKLSLRLNCGGQLLTDLIQYEEVKECQGLLCNNTTNWE